MRRWRAALAAFTVALGLAGAVAQASGVSVTDMSASFPSGRYVGLTVDPRDPRSVAVTTADGRIGWTHDGGITGDEATVLAPREVLSAPLRSLPSLLSLLPQRPVARTALSGLHGEAPGTRQFLWRLKEGLPVTRWHYWMAIENPPTEVYDATIPSAGRTAFAATAGGLFLGDRSGAWVRTIGLPQPRRGGVVVYAVTADPTDDRRVLAGTSIGLLISRDGGESFAPHPDPALAEIDVRRFYRDAAEPRHLLALAARAVFQSRDGGVTFARSFATSDGVNAVAIDDDGAYVATGRGLIVPGRRGRALPDEAVVGVVPLGAGAWLAATASALYLHAADGELRRLMGADGESGDPFLRLEGSAGAAWLLTRHAVFRVASDRLARAPRVTNPPRLLLSATGVERAVLSQMGIADPTDSRLGKPWLAYLAPRITLNARGAVSHEFATTVDALLPFPERMRTMGRGSSCCGFTPREGPAELLVLVSWDLAPLFGGFGQRTPSYPYGIIEMNIRAVREQVLPEVRWRYREAAQLAKLLARPPADPEVAFLWETRLEEHAAFLEALSGRPVVALGTSSPD
jgi:hypothetical protein